jgi:hypothetical protein
LSVRDVVEAEAFYEPWLTLLGYRQIARDDGGCAWERRGPIAGAQWLILNADRG